GPVHGALSSCVGSTGRFVCTSATGAGVAVGVLVIIYLAILVVVILAYVRIITKAGYSGWWVLIALVPLVNVVMFLVFAFSEWPIEKELARLRSQRGYLGGGGYAPPSGSWGGAGPRGGGSGAMSASSVPPAAVPYGAYGAQPEAAGASDWAPAGTDLPSFAAGPTPSAGDDRSPGGGVDAPASGGSLSPVMPTQPAEGSPPAQSAPPGAAPAGWYPTPDGRRRYWDGAAWTDHFA
ncbi:MAG TPA: DUF2510 domain-containing protein, partial [Acidimicrobiales bacterium]|nr:DUF2510 domain-containing protein [Acidimicrobiales bacterium]